VQCLVELLPVSDVEEVSVPDFVEGEVVDELPPEVVVYTSLSVDPNDPERQHLVWFDRSHGWECDSLLSIGQERGAVPTTFSELAEVLPTAFIVEVDRSPWRERVLPELVLYTGLQIDPNDPDGQRLVRRVL
jgi:hypothetical protein